MNTFSLAAIGKRTDGNWLKPQLSASQRGLAHPDWFGLQPDAIALLNNSDDLVPQGNDFSGGGASAIDERESVAAGYASPSQRELLVKSRCSSSHAAGTFTSPSLAAKCGTADAPAAFWILERAASGTTGFLKKLPALAQSGSPSTSSMPFGPANLAYSGSDLGKARRVLPVLKVSL